MPIHWTIDCDQRLFTAVGEGDISFSNAVSFLEALSHAGGVPYRKLFDGRGIKSQMSAEELLTLCAKIRSYHGKDPIGPLAIVATPEQTLQFARLLGALAAADRPMKIFSSERKARNWIDKHMGRRLPRPGS